MILDNFKKISPKYTSFIFYGLILISAGACYGFTSVSTHPYSNLLLALISGVVFNIFLSDVNQIQYKNLYTDAGMFILPLLLMRTNSIWEQLIVILLLEILKFMSFALDKKRKTELAMQNYINTIFKLFLFILTNLVYFFITQSDTVEISYSISNPLIILVPVLFYIMALIYIGVFNSKDIESGNIKSYADKNLLMYFVVFKVIIPIILMVNAKTILKKVSFEQYLDLRTYFIVVSILAVSFCVKRLYESKQFETKVISLYSLNLIPFCTMYLLKTDFKEAEFSFILFLVASLHVLYILFERYKVLYGERIKSIFIYIVYCSPISPLLWVKFYHLSTFDSFEVDRVKLIVFCISIIPILFLTPEANKLGSKGNSAYNKYVTYRVAYLILTGLTISIFQIL